MNHHVADEKLAPQGKRRIEWAEGQMPVLRVIRARFEKEKPLKGIRLGACLHVTTETANLCRTLAAGGAQVALCASNPLSTQNDAAAALVKEYKIPTFAVRGEDEQTYYQHIGSVLEIKPHLTLDDGADLVSAIHTKYVEQAKTLMASLEETTTGVNRLKAMEKEGSLKIPVVAVNDAQTKYLFDNRYGTGQSTIDGIIRATNVLLAGKTIVIVGYGWCGRGVATRARAMGAKVVLVEVDAIRALEAAMEGFQVMPMASAVEVGDLFITLTGNKHVIRVEHFERMKDGAMTCNSGHFDIELDLVGLRAVAKEIVKNVRDNVDLYRLKNGKSIFVLGEGRLVNLTCAEGHPAAVMDMSFATQALSVEYVVKQKERLTVRVHSVPLEIEQWIAQLKLQTMGISLDTMTKEQKAYLAGWREGT